MFFLQFLTGPIWKSCADYCSKCLGKEKGECVAVENKKCSGGYQCSCSGKDVPKSTKRFVKFTCSLGL
ncbi:hypothetical protein OESDEN_11958 [Oesophagostomum dentatum]|uniref:Uncharacterized protein n=1 Tax=Oesophagostomum dentatum TaxID=61180 RepID=A0A0B1SSH7_OESDE|nr:hypothetical protein OESDEN_11958 [Oesophagostomum dentatum]